VGENTKVVKTVKVLSKPGTARSRIILYLSNAIEEGFVDLPV